MATEKEALHLAIDPLVLVRALLEIEVLLVLVKVLLEIEAILVMRVRLEITALLVASILLKETTATTLIIMTMVLPVSL